jgi:hypothetical protein
MRLLLPSVRLALVLGILCWAAAPAEAGFSVKVTVGSQSTTVTDGGSGDADPDAGSISSVVTVGNYKVTITANTSSPGADGQGVVTQTSLTIRKKSATTDSVIIEVVSDGFTFANQGSTLSLTNAVSSTLMLGDGNTPTASATSSLNTSTTDAAVLSGTISGSAQSASTSKTVIVPTNPFTLSNKVVITDLNVYNGDSSTDANIGVTTTAQLPAPPSLALLASALPLGGLLYLRRRKKA